MPSAWNMFVKKIFEEGRKINGKTYKFSQALKDASKRKAEMGVGAVKTVAKKVASKVKNVTKKLRGKNKTNYTPHVDCGDHVVIINAKDVKLTGKKLTDKVYYWHTGYPGGIKSKTAEKILGDKHPERVVEKAVFGMMSRGPLQRDIMKKLKVYAGSEHPHEAQKPEIFDIASKNNKNKR